jgi:hypothetical protein
MRSIKTKLSFREVTRAEREAELPDYLRFEHPELYMTVDDLKYFRSDKQRELFKERFYDKKENNGKN